MPRLRTRCDAHHTKAFCARLRRAAIVPSYGHYVAYAHPPGRVHGAVPTLARVPPRGGAYVPAVSPAYLSQKLTRPLVTKDGGTLCTVLDARTYMLALPKRRETAAQWQRAAELLLAQADVAARAWWPTPVSRAGRLGSGLQPSADHLFQGFDERV